jgi:hypothetical protein
MNVVADQFAVSVSTQATPTFSRNLVENILDFGQLIKFAASSLTSGLLSTAVTNYQLLRMA